MDPNPPPPFLRNLVMIVETLAAESPSTATVTPEPILQLAMAFWASKTLLSAVELGVFTELAAQPMTASELAARLSCIRAARAISSTRWSR